MTIHVGIQTVTSSTQSNLSNNFTNPEVSDDKPTKYTPKVTCKDYGTTSFGR